MEIQDIIINSFITMFSLGLLIVSLASYKKYKNTKLLFITAVFILFSIKAIIISLGFSDGILLRFCALRQLENDKMLIMREK